MQQLVCDIGSYEAYYNIDMKFTWVGNITKKQIELRDFLSLSVTKIEIKQIKQK